MNFFRQAICMRNLWQKLQKKKRFKRTHKEFPFVGREFSMQGVQRKIRRTKSAQASFASSFVGREEI